MPNDPARHRRPRINIGVVGNITGGTVIAVGHPGGSDADELSIDHVVDVAVAADNRDSAEPLRRQATRLDRADG